MLKIEMNCCPNPKCRKPLKKLIIVSEESKDGTKIEYGCPHCMTKLDPTKTQLFKEETVIKEETQKEERKPKAKKPPGCPKYFGYLNNGLKDSIILQECLICPQMLDCTRDKS